MIFSETFCQLKTNLKIFKYYWKFISNYAVLTELLIIFKIKQFKKAFIKSKNKMKFTKFN